MPAKHVILSLSFVVFIFLAKDYVGAAPLEARADKVCGLVSLRDSGSKKKGDDLCTEELNAYSWVDRAYVVTPGKGKLKRKCDHLVELHLVNEVLTEKEQGLCTHYNNKKIPATLVTKTLEDIKRMVNDPKENLFTVTGAMEDLKGDWFKSKLQGTTLRVRPAMGPKAYAVSDYLTKTRPHSTHVVQGVDAMLTSLYSSHDLPPHKHTLTQLWGSRIQEYQSWVEKTFKPQAGSSAHGEGGHGGGQTHPQAGHSAHGHGHGKRTVNDTAHTLGTSSESVSNNYAGYGGRN